MRYCPYSGGGDLLKKFSKGKENQLPYLLAPEGNSAAVDDGVPQGGCGFRWRSSCISSASRARCPCEQSAGDRMLGALTVGHSGYGYAHHHVAATTRTVCRAGKAPRRPAQVRPRRHYHPRERHFWSRDLPPDHRRDRRPDFESACVINPQK